MRATCTRSSNGSPQSANRRAPRVASHEVLLGDLVAEALVAVRRVPIERFQQPSLVAVRLAGRRVHVIEAWATAAQMCA